MPHIDDFELPTPRPITTSYDEDRAMWIAFDGAMMMLAWQETQGVDGATPTDLVFITYIRGGISEGYAAELVADGDRLEFREKLGRWIGGLIEYAPVPTLTLCPEKVQKIEEGQS